MSRTLTSKMLHKTNLQVFLWFSEYSCRYVVILIISAPTYIHIYDMRNGNGLVRFGWAQRANKKEIAQLFS